MESQVTQRGQPRSSRVRQGQYNQRTDSLTRASQIDTVDMLKAFVLLCYIELFVLLYRYLGYALPHNYIDLQLGTYFEYEILISDSCLE